MCRINVSCSVIYEHRTFGELLEAHGAAASAPPPGVFGSTSRVTQHRARHRASDEAVGRHRGLAGLCWSRAAAGQLCWILAALRGVSHHSTGLRGPEVLPLPCTVPDTAPCPAAPHVSMRRATSRHLGTRGVRAQQLTWG